MPAIIRLSHVILSGPSSAYASGALVKCRKVGAANWGNKSEEMDYGSFQQKNQKSHLQKQNKRENNSKRKQTTKKEEWIVDNAAQYFFNEGINEDGFISSLKNLELKILLFVHDLVEDSELIEIHI